MDKLELTFSEYIGLSNMLMDFIESNNIPESDLSSEKCRLVLYRDYKNNISVDFGMMK